MHAYRLIYRLISPLLLGKHPITLDALAYAALFARSGDEEWSREQLKYYFVFTDGVPHASALAFGRTRQHSLIAKPACLLGGLRSERDLNSDFIKPNGHRGHYAKIKLEGGPYRFRIDNYRGYWSPYICFDFLGDRERLEILLENFVIGIGARAQIGAGQVDLPQFVSLPRDFSLFDDEGRAARPLPPGMCTKRPNELSGIAEKGVNLPPYWRTSAIDVVSCERIRLINL